MSAVDDVSLDPEGLRLLADPLRARLVALLAREELCTCHLVELTGAGQTNISNHLRALRAAGLVTAEPCGRYTWYRASPQALRLLAAPMGALADLAEQRTPRRACP